MIEMLNKEDAKGPSILELAKEIQRQCFEIKADECHAKCPAFNRAYGACALNGLIPADWDLDQEEEDED